MPFLTFQSHEGVQRVELTRKLTGIGRSSDNRIVLSDEAVLPYHAQILRDGANWVLSSLDREAVLIVNGRDRRNCSLCDGDLLLLGGTELTFTDQVPTPEFVPAPVRATAPGTGVDSRLEKISTFAEKLLLGMAVPEIFKTLLDSVVSLTGASKGFLIHVRGDELHIPAARNVDRVDVGPDLEQVSDSVIARVLKERRPLIVSDALNDTILGQSRSVMDLKLSSVMCVPLMAREQLIGVLYVGNEGLERLFVEQDLELLKKFGNTLDVGVSITTDDESVREEFEPRAPSIARRLEVLKVLSAEGISVHASVAPLLPMNPDRFIELLSPYVDSIWIDSIGHQEVNTRKELLQKYKTFFESKNQQLLRNKISSYFSAKSSTTKSAMVTSASALSTYKEKEEDRQITLVI